MLLACGITLNSLYISTCTALPGYVGQLELSLCLYEISVDCQLSRDWFTSAEASAKRRHIQNVILQLHQTSPSSGPPNNAKSLSLVGISTPDDDGDFCVSSDSELIRSDLVASFRKQLCGQLEASGKQPDSLDSISEVEIVSATASSDNNEDFLLLEEDWWSVSCTSHHTNPSFTVDERGQRSSTSPVRSSQLPSILELPTAIMESVSGRVRSPDDGRSGRDEGEERVSTPFNKDEQSNRKRPRLAITPFVLEEDTTTAVLERNLHSHKHVQCKRLSYLEESQCCKDIK